MARCAARGGDGALRGHGRHLPCSGCAQGFLAAGRAGARPVRRDRCAPRGEAEVAAAVWPAVSDRFGLTAPMSEPLPPQANPHLFGHAPRRAVHARGLAQRPAAARLAAARARAASARRRSPTASRAACWPAPSTSGPPPSRHADVPHGGERGPIPTCAILERDRQSRRPASSAENRRRPGARLPTTPSTRPPARAGCKVLIVDLADELNPNGANALLKLLEEPPASAVLLLVCQRPGLPAAHHPLALRAACADAVAHGRPRGRAGAACARASGRGQARRPGRAGRRLARPGARAGRGRLARPLCRPAAQARPGAHQPGGPADLASELAKGGDGQGFRTTADLLGIVRRAAWPPSRLGRTPHARAVSGEHAPAGRARRRPRP